MLSEQRASGPKHLVVTIRKGLKETSVSCVGGLGNLASDLTRGLSGHDSREAPVR